MQASTKSNLILVLCTAFWGLTFPLIANAMHFIDPGLFVTIRVIISTLVFLPFIISRLRYADKVILWGGVIIGLMNGLTYVFQSVGLVTIPASRSAFITGASVVIVPLLMPLFRLGRPGWAGGISMVVCMIGLYILTGANLSHLGVGDLWTLGCALTYALGILFIQIFSVHTKEYSLFAFMQIFFSIPFAAMFAHGADVSAIMHPVVIVALLFCSIFATSLVFYLQTKYQQYTTAAKAAIIFALEPVFATIFSFFMNNEVITRYTIIGGILILFSIILPDILLLMKQRQR